ncbi:sulfatase family protein [Tichowtungia aerotolerans]|uniref:Sulfatase-like hydrolase/transferase n=1 Tax=Tichowtungia aerotolerans TaxID=2697043 RepID=A0A6P1MFF6_9BACT|nr:sulfatase-like hydrolase/transferase [Tichowtungia aerotolerans]QHI69805.1 sulfatase-like hydrolase/transferase [Tichowtungia aerotolerans]
MKRLFFYSAAALALSVSAEPPNVLVVMMDDFGGGQFAPLADRLNEQSFDPAFVSFVASMKNGGQYSNTEALAAARKAMPTMSRLAADGLLFTRAFSAAALCAPSRCGLATAMHPNRFGIYENSDVNAWPGALPPEKILMPYFKAAGYVTGHIGKWHLGPLNEEMARPIFEKYGLSSDTNPHSLKKNSPAYKELEAVGYFGSVPDALNPLNNGFDFYYGYNYHQSKFYGDSNVWNGFEHAGKQEGYNTETFTEKALSFINSAAKEKQPFFLNLHVHAVHGPLFPNPPEKYMKPFEGMPNLLKNFYGHVFAVDEAIRSVIETLEKNGQLQNTLIVFTGDNGGSVQRESPLPGNAPHRGHKGNYIQGGIRVPLVISWPAQIHKGHVTSELVSLLDILPTAMDAAGISIPDGLDGRSLLPFIEHSGSGPHDQLVWFGLESRSWGFLRETAFDFQKMRSKEPGSWTVVTDEWLLRFTGEIVPGLYRDYPDGNSARMELYSVKDDPGETHNLAGQYPETVATLKAIAAKRAKTLPPPSHWNRLKWQELQDSLEK